MQRASRIDRYDSPLKRLCKGNLDELGLSPTEPQFKPGVWVANNFF